MKQRCENPNRPCYKFYGGKGIKVTDSWSDYEMFSIWALANGYNENLTIDRIDSNKNYEPNNCVWIPMIENIKKTTSSRMKPIAQYDLKGNHIANFESVTSASKILGIAKSNLFANLKGKYKTTNNFIFKWILKEIKK